MACLPAPSPADAACAPASPAPDTGMLPAAARGSFVPCLAPFPSLPGPAPAAPRLRRRPPRPRAAPRGGASQLAAAPRGLPGLHPAGAAAAPGALHRPRGGGGGAPCPLLCSPPAAAAGRRCSGRARRPRPRRERSPAPALGNREGSGAAAGEKAAAGKGLPRQGAGRGGRARAAGARGAGAGAVGGVTAARPERPAPTPRDARGVPGPRPAPPGLPLCPRPLLPEQQCVPEPGGFPSGDSAKYHRLLCRDASHLRRPVGDFPLDLDLSFSHQRLEELSWPFKTYWSFKTI